ncbi:MAG: hypothetical protein Q7K40_00125 [bacterium]|nr:hypothetical protein [bacterium]
MEKIKHFLHVVNVQFFAGLKDFVVTSIFELLIFASLALVAFFIFGF